MIDAREKIALFIDGANFYATNKALGVEVDYRKFLSHYQAQAYVVRSYYYTAVQEDAEFTSVRPLIDWLDYNGFTVVTKPTKEYQDREGRNRVRTNMNMEIAVNALEMAPFYDHAVIFSGNGEFLPLVEALQRKGKRVTAVSTIATDMPMIADDLRRQVDFFVDLQDLTKHIGRPVRIAANA